MSATSVNLVSACSALNKKEKLVLFSRFIVNAELPVFKIISSGISSPLTSTFKAKSSCCIALSSLFRIKSLNRAGGVNLELYLISLNVGSETIPGDISSNKNKMNKGGRAYFRYLRFFLRLITAVKGTGLNFSIL
ncbi:MAG: hypothetical protein NTW31_07315 [Bacteroidetes bacterium]|nr:hypothetical protein [Bacteroidota bacterium]